MKRRLFKLRHLILSGIAAALFWVVGSWQGELVLFTRILQEIPEFRDYNNSTTTKTFHMVCLTHKKNINYKYFENPLSDTWFAKTWSYTFFDRRCCHQQKDITVYVENTANIKPDAYKLGFQLNFKSKSEIPKDYTLRNETAYFLGNPWPREPQNFYHFVKQIYFPLYWLMKSTNALHSEAKNVVFYPAPYAVCEKDKRVTYHNPDKFRAFTDILHIKNKLELSAFVDKPDPHKVCYKNAVFSSDIFLRQGRESIEYFKSKLNLRSDICKPKTLTIVNRGSYRRILNAGKLAKIAQELGYNAKEVVMENLTVKDQAQVIHCTNVFMAVQGAAMQWAYFMKDNSGAAIEVAWPDEEWPFSYSVPPNQEFSTDEPGVVWNLKFVQLKGKAVRHLQGANIYASDFFKKNINFTEQQLLDLFNDERNFGILRNVALSLGKVHDTVIDENLFKKTLLALG